MRGSDPGRKRSGSQRIALPAETLARYRPLMRRCGITRIADVTGLDRIGIPVALAVRPNARSVAVSQGKGVDPASAKASALMEAIEIWHAENIRLPLTLASIGDVTSAGQGIDVGRLPAVADAPRSDNLRLLWIEGRDILADRPVLVPFEMVHADYAEPEKPGHGFFHASTNGLASGNHPLEALCHAISELIERDAVSLWHALPPDRRAATRLVLESVHDPACARLIETFAAAGLDPALWDVTSDLAVPAFLCLISPEPGVEAHIGLGSGAHPDAGIALSRALTEAAQTRLTYIAGSRDDLEAGEFAAAGLAHKRRYADWLLEAASPLRDFAAVAGFRSDTLRDDLDWLVARLAACGIAEIAAVDLSRAELGVPVVRVVIPGLEAPHDEFGYVAGRRAVAAVEPS